MKLVIVKTFEDSISAHILKLKLEDESITCFIHDENIVTLNPLFNNAVGGIKVKVYEKDVEQALEIIRVMDQQPHTDDQDQIIVCPNCGSTDLHSNFKSMKDAKGILSAITMFFFTVFPLYYNSVYRCKNCDTEFKVK